MAYSFFFRWLYVPENIQSIKKYQRGDEQKALWVCTAKKKKKNELSLH